MPEFKGLHINLARRGPGAQQAAAPLFGPATVRLGQRFRKQLFDFPMHFLAAIEMEGFLPVRLQWIALCKTAGIVLLRGTGIDPDVFSLLLNGVESEDDMALIYQHVPPLWRHWQRVLDEPRPLLVNGYYHPSRMKDPAVTTILVTFASTYFDQFGTSGE